MPLFPMFLKLSGRPVLVIGAGKVGETKIAGLLEAETQVRVVALSATATVQEWALEGRIVLEQREFASEDLCGAFLVVAATSSAELNELVFREAKRRGILCNVVDVPELCDFYYPAVVRRGDLQIAISTTGRSPAFAQRLRRELDKRFGAEYAQVIEQLGEIRERLFAADIPAERRRRLLHYMARRKSRDRLIKKAGKPT